MNKVILCIILPCVIAMVSSAYIMQNPYAYQTAGQSQQPGQYAAYAANSNQALRQSRLFNYLLGGLYFLNLFNVTGNRIQG